MNKIYQLKIVKAFLQLIRWPNLLFIFSTQAMFEYCIVMPLFVDAGINNALNISSFLLLSFSLVCIAAGGYVINDYFDLNIDLVNKPKRLVVDKTISRRWVIFWHFIFSIVGIALGFYIDKSTPTSFIGIFNVLSVLLLFVYSASLKKKFLLGNVLISLLTAWSILILWWAEQHYFFAFPPIGNLDTHKLFRFTFLYAGFAFIISLIREVIKDMEDIDGDRKYGCKTMPIIWGINSTKVFTLVWTIVLTAVLLLLQLYVLLNGWWITALYGFICITLPLLQVIRLLVKAQNSKNFHQLSTLVKIIMFTGIVSMLFFRHPM
ncbi:geranylgeranylglycerol-phosphate geranylgeranyltransferase [Hydrotalea sp.]|uniref:geranylgeranylglycerol-phosphate geranylgeranyltransferase n=1 Tax=Hydrotalea sp. TaxID=2881279 RepID=UPI002628EDAB|nr:geranylgeranylglycerol-phosphate geranylgeranyltransferase [Hydrotalea sp.]